MVSKLLDIWKYIVGQEHGFGDAGIDQWYYTVGVAINIMLVWWLKPEVALVFTILSVIHYLTVIGFGFFDLIDENVIYSYIYLGIHLLLLLIAVLINYKWALFALVIAVIAYLLSIVNESMCHTTWANLNEFSLLVNTLVLVVFIIVDFLLPIALWLKFVILAITLVLHPLIDYIESLDIGILDTTTDIFDNIAGSLRYKKTT